MRLLIGTEPLQAPVINGHIMFLAKKAVPGITPRSGHFIAWKNQWDGRSLAQQPAPASSPDVFATLTKTSAKLAGAKSAQITLSDGKITPLGFSVYTDEKVEFAITNNSKEARDFKIEKLNFDSGMIKPGETKKANLDSLPQEQAMYNYISTGAKDSPKYAGTLIVLVKK